MIPHGNLQWNYRETVSGTSSLARSVSLFVYIKASYSAILTIPSPLVGTAARKSVTIPIQLTLAPTLNLPSMMSRTEAIVEGICFGCRKRRVDAILTHDFLGEKKEESSIFQVTNQGRVF